MFFRGDMRVKVCGITNLDDALICVNAGADALGFNFCQSSKRYIDPQDAKEIIKKLPPFINKVGVFANEFIGPIKYIADFTGIDTIQFSGLETPEFCNQFLDYQFIKTIHLGTRRHTKNSIKLILHRTREYNTNNIMFDSGSFNTLGGTGKPFDWNIFEILKDNEIIKDKNIIIAGGLNCDNIKDILAIYKPYAVDVASGVESEPGIKDAKKLKRFISIIKKFRE
ncbi:MAG: phosphoribosylanthranilate isomerase [Candidatus Hydrogenedentota bacterium]